MAKGSKQDAQAAQSRGKKSPSKPSKPSGPVQKRRPKNKSATATKEESQPVAPKAAAEQTAQEQPDSTPGTSSKERQKAKRKMRKALRKQKAKEQEKARKERQLQQGDSTAAQVPTKQAQKPKPVASKPKPKQKQKQKQEHEQQKPVVNQTKPAQKPPSTAAEGGQQQQKDLKQGGKKKQREPKEQKKQTPSASVGETGATQKNIVELQSDVSAPAKKRQSSSLQAPPSAPTAGTAQTPSSAEPSAKKRKNEDADAAQEGGDMKVNETQPDGKKVSNWAILKHKISKEASRKLNAKKPVTNPASADAACSDSVNDLSKATDELAIDCEMVGAGPKGSKSLLARIAIVNNIGDIVYHKYVKPTEYVTDYRFRVTGIKHSDIQNGEAFHKVRTEVSKIICDKILVGHAIQNDLKALRLHHKPELIRDTAQHSPLMLDQAKPRSLKDLAKDLLGKIIQTGAHSPIEDARATMEIYMKVKGSWTT